MGSREHGDNPMEALLSGKEEDRFTELLARLLREKDVAASFLRRVCGFEQKIGRPEVHTQVVISDGRPDLVITGPDYLLVFEAKLASWLHDDQLAPYAAFIAKSKTDAKRLDARLILLGPEGARGAMEAAGREQAPSAFSSVISWEAVARFCRSESSAHPGTRVGFYLEDFASLIEYRLGGLPRPLTADEAELLADPLVARAVNAARLAVAELVAALGKDPKVVVGRTNAGGGYEGYTLRHNGKAWWFGFWPSAWPSVGRSPVMLQLHGVDADGRPPVLEGLEPAVRFSADGRRGWVVPLVLRPGVDPSELAAAHAQTVVGWVTRAADTGGA